MSEPQSTVAPRSAPGRVLVVDDNDSHLETLEPLLEGQPYDRSYCHDGPAAIALAREREFDVLLTDVRMAPLDGVATARAIKELQPEIAVIMMTGFAKEDTPLEALRLGAVDYIDKPIRDVRAFLRLLERQVSFVRDRKNLRAIRELLDTVVQQVDTGIVAIDVTGATELMNDAARQLLCPREARPLGRPFQEICPLTEVRQLAPAAGTVSTTVETEVDGRRRLLQVDATRLTGAAGQAGGVVVLLKDLTTLAERQRAEGWRQMSRAITHGMKTPLGTLRLRLETLRAREAASAIGGQRTAELDAILAVVNELHGRLTDLVDFVKLDFTPVRIDLNAVVERAVKAFERHCRPEASLEFIAANSATPIEGSASALALAVENLLANSQESTAGAIEIEVSVGMDIEARQATVTVVDNGPGIAPEVREDVFARPLNSTKPGGSGLGAALVRTVVDQHRGTLIWESPLADGRGTRVTLAFPLAM